MAQYTVVPSIRFVGVVAVMLDIVAPVVLTENAAVPFAVHRTVFSVDTPLACEVKTACWTPPLSMRDVTPAIPSPYWS